MTGKGYPGKKIAAEAQTLLRTLHKKKFVTILVSNEVGLGIVPNNKMARDFRDTAGIVNQIAARQADKVYFTVSGIPLLIKGAV
jgi:adenosylcobinamide kinase/adenosylcobinamide-phosphate guanylyltransferase